MNAYEQKRQARIERLRGRADRLAGAAESTLAAAKKMGDVIPFGQPVHGKTDRNYREKLGRKYEKGFALAQEAKDAERRADHAEASTAISSDDPDALSKLKAKLAKLEDARARMVEANRAIRSGKSDAVLADITGMPVDDARKLREPDSFGNIGFPAYKLTNVGNEVRRLKARIEELEAKAWEPAKAPELVGEVRIEESDNRVRIIFPGKPAEDLRKRMKSEGFRYSPSAGAWQRMPTAWVWELARRFAGEYLGGT